ncbi:MAG: hypothetical protein ABH881_03860 [bacterium]
MFKKIFLFYIIFCFLFISRVHASEITGEISTVYGFRIKNAEEDKQEKIKVLAVNYFAPGTLVRGSDKKIYVMEISAKRYISSLAELEKYFSSRAIYDVNDEELAQYKTTHKTREYFDGELIRGIGEEKVYEIRGKSKYHILNIEELRVNYFGKEILNVKMEILEIYKPLNIL